MYELLLAMIAFSFGVAGLLILWTIFKHSFWRGVLCLLVPIALIWHIFLLRKELKPSYLLLCAGFVLLIIAQAVKPSPIPFTDSSASVQRVSTGENTVQGKTEPAPAKKYIRSRSGRDRSR